MVENCRIGVTGKLSGIAQLQAECDDDDICLSDFGVVRRCRVVGAVLDGNGEAASVGEVQSTHFSGG